MKRLIVTAVLAASLVLPAAAFADIAPNSSTIGSLSVPKEASVTMTKELVQFTLPAKLAAPMMDTKTNKWTVPTMPATATFWMKNAGKKAVSQEIFFPVTYQLATTGETAQYAKNVRVWVNGRVVDVSSGNASYVAMTDGKLAPSAVGLGFSFTAKLPANATSTVVVRFDAPLGNNYNNQDQPTVDYLFASGAGWAGKIGQATVEFVYPTKAKAAWVVQSGNVTAGLTKVTPKANGKVVDFTYTNFEPVRGDVAEYVFLTPALAKTKSASAGLTKIPGPWAVDAYSNIRKVGNALWGLLEDRPQTQNNRYPGCDSTHPQNCP